MPCYALRACSEVTMDDIYVGIAQTVPSRRRGEGGGDDRGRRVGGVVHDRYGKHVLL